MLDGYYGLDKNEGDQSNKRKKLLAMQAALELAKAALGNTTQSDSVSQAGNDLKYVSQQLAATADAIRQYLD